MKHLRAHDVLPAASITGAAFLTIPEAARYLRCSPSLLYKIGRGEIHDAPPLPTFHIGRRTLIRHTSLSAWVRLLEAREREGKFASGMFAVRKDGSSTEII